MSLINTAYSYCIAKTNLTNAKRKKEALSTTTNNILVIDQYEELITQCLDSYQKGAFEQQLAKSNRLYLFNQDGR